MTLNINFQCKPNHFRRKILSESFCLKTIFLWKWVRKCSYFWASLSLWAVFFPNWLQRICWQFCTAVSQQIMEAKTQSFLYEGLELRWNGKDSSSIFILTHSVLFVITKCKKYFWKHAKNIDNKLLDNRVFSTFAVRELSLVLTSCRTLFISATSCINCWKWVSLEYKCQLEDICQTDQL